MNFFLAAKDRQHHDEPLPQGENAVTVCAVRVRYAGEEKPALDIENLALKRGVRTALLGLNGAGKSTLLKAIAGLLPLERGEIEVLGRAAGTCHHRIAYVSQVRDVDWRFPVTAGEVALMGRDVHIRWPRRPSQNDRQQSLDALEKVGMSDFASRHIAELSGGQRQRVFLARALAQDAELLLLDEPFTGVDTATEAIIGEVIFELCAAGKTIVVATHDLARVEANFDCAVLLCREIIAQGTPAQVLQPEPLARAYGGPLALFAGREMAVDSHVAV